MEEITLDKMVCGQWTYAEQNHATLVNVTLDQVSENYRLGWVRIMCRVGVMVMVSFGVRKSHAKVAHATTPFFNVSDDQMLGNPTKYILKYPSHQQLI